jgi:hypothetical protein
VSIGTHVAKFRFEALGFGRTQAPAIAESRDGRARISFESDHASCRVEISLNGFAEPHALADRTAEGFYERFLLVFGGRVERSSPPRLEGQHSLKAGSGAYRVLLSVDPAAIVPILQRVVFDVEARPVPFAAALYAARKMYRIALESGDEVAAYLILYSALGLASLFKFGLEKGRGQEALDRWILEEDRSVRTFERKTKRNRKIKPTPETLYTYLRNQFIHAEDRGADPEGAIKGFRANLSRFRLLAATMLAKL